MPPNEKDPFRLKPKQGTDIGTAPEDLPTQFLSLEEQKRLFAEADRRLEDADVVLPPTAPKKSREVRIFPPGDSMAAARAREEKPTQFIRPASLFITSKAFGDTIEHPGADAARRAREAAAAKEAAAQKAAEEEDSRKIAEDVIFGMARIFARIAATEPTKIRDTLSAAAIQLNKHREYRYLLKSSRDAAALYDNLNSGLYAMYNVDNSITSDPNYAVLWNFINDGITASTR